MTSIFEFINTLKKIDIQEIKNIDWVRLKDDLRHRPDILLNILLIGLTIFGTITMVKNSQTSNDKLLKKVQLNREKLAQIKELDASDKTVKDFLDKFPKTLSGEELVDRINDVAFKYKIQLSAFSPIEKKIDTYSEVTKLNITINCKDFESMVSFIKELEESEFAIRIDQWMGRMNGGDTKPKLGENPTGDIEANIDVSVVKLRNG